MNKATLETLERLATKHGVATMVFNGEELEVSRIVKSRHRRYSYRLGQRHLARDQVLNEQED